LWKSWPAGVYDSHWAPTAGVFPPHTHTYTHIHTQTCTQWVLPADTQLHSLLQLHLLSPWKPCLLLNPPCSQTQTHTHTRYGREIGRLRLPLCLIWCYRTHRITAPSKPRPICTHTHTAVGLGGCSRLMLNTEPAAHDLITCRLVWIMTFVQALTQPA